MESKSKLLLSPAAMILMAGGAFLSVWAINTLSLTAGGMVVVELVLLSILLYVAGAVWMGRIVDKPGISNSYIGINSGIVFALLLIATGLLLLCLNSGVIPAAWKSFFFSWPMILFLLGVLEISKRHFIFGFIMAVAGNFFLLSKMPVLFPDESFSEHFIYTYWPVLIILSGVLIIMGIVLKPKSCKEKRYKHHKSSWSEFAQQSTNRHDGEVDYRFVFSGAEQVILDPVFNGGNIETIFGGLELDLRHTALPEGETFLQVTTIFGGVVIKVPDNWEIEIHSAAFMGGVNDKYQKRRPGGTGKKLTINAKCVFGGLEIG